MACVPEFAARAIREYLAQRKADGDEDAARLLAKLPGKKHRKDLDPKIRPSGPTKAQSDRAVYAEVTDRDGGLCTVQLAIFGKCYGHLEIDHQWGRGKEPTKVENCRKLCHRHHRMKTDNEPSRLMWLCDYREHALSHDYYAEVAKTDAQIQLERAQHPASRAAGGTR